MKHLTVILLVLIMGASLRPIQAQDKVFTDRENGCTFRVPQGFHRDPSFRDFMEWKGPHHQRIRLVDGPLLYPSYTEACRLEMKEASKDRRLTDFVRKIAVHSPVASVAYRYELAENDEHIMYLRTYTAQHRYTMLATAPRRDFDKVRPQFEAAITSFQLLAPAARQH